MARSAFLGLALVALPAVAQDEASRAKAVLWAAGQRFKDLKTLKATAEWSQEGVAARHPHVIYLRRPHLWRVDQTRGQNESSLIHDGKQTWSHMKTFKKFIRNMDQKHSLMQSGGPVAQLFLAPDASLLLERTSKLGHKRETVEGKEVDVVRYFREWDNSDVEVWIEPDRKIRKVLWSSKVGGEVNPTTYRRSFEYLSEEHDPELDPELFAFTPPPDALEMGARDRDGSLLQEGAEAQDAEAVDTAGKKAKLSDFKGKPVVLLFWSEKGEGCAEALAALDLLRQAYKGAVFLAVNQGDSAAALKAFLGKSKTGLRVLRQKSDEIGRAFGVEKLPTTYVLSGERKVVLRHGGYYEERVREVLDRLAPKK